MGDHNFDTMWVITSGAIIDNGESPWEFFAKSPACITLCISNVTIYGNSIHTGA